MPRRHQRTTAALASALATIAAAFAGADGSAPAAVDYRFVSKPIVTLTRPAAPSDRTPRFFVYVRLNRDVPSAPNRSPQGVATLGGPAVRAHRPPPPADTRSGWGFVRLGPRGSGCYIQTYDLVGPDPQRLGRAKVGDALTVKVAIRGGRTLTARVRVQRLRGTRIQRGVGSEEIYAKRLGCAR